MNDMLSGEPSSALGKKQFLPSLHSLPKGELYRPQTGRKLLMTHKGIYGTSYFGFKREPKQAPEGCSKAIGLWFGDSSCLAASARRGCPGDFGLHPLSLQCSELLEPVSSNLLSSSPLMEGGGGAAVDAATDTPGKAPRPKDWSCFLKGPSALCGLDVGGQERLGAIRDA